MYRLFVGRTDSPFQRCRSVLFATVVGVAPLVAYAVGVFEATSGTVWVPVDATIVGTVAAFSFGLRYRGLLTAWIASTPRASRL